MTRGRYPKGSIGGPTKIVNLDKKKRKPRKGVTFKTLLTSTNVTKECLACEGDIEPGTEAWFNPKVKQWRHKGCRKVDGW